MKYSQTRRMLLSFFLCLCLLTAGCQTTEEASLDQPPSVSTKRNAVVRDGTPLVLTPVADGTKTYTCDVAAIDASHTCEGYLMVSYTGSNPKVKLQITGPDDTTYTYNLHGGYEVFPLTAESGSYRVCVFENVSGNQYSTVLSKDISVQITNKFGPYLYPNQYVNFTEDSPAIAEAARIAKSSKDDLDVVSDVYNYIIDNFTYDYDKASNVESGYVPAIDEIFASRTGICFDYAAVMAAMLRSQQIPTRLEVGYMGDAYHAWISIYIQEIGWINGMIAFDGKEWNLMDPTFASTSQSPRDFITDNSQYITKYVY